MYSSFLLLMQSWNIKEFGKSNANAFTASKITSLISVNANNYNELFPIYTLFGC